MSTPLRTLVFAVILAFLATFTACGSGDDRPVVSPGLPLAAQPGFGGNDTECVSIELRNELDDEGRARAGSQCFLDAVATGEAIVWDIVVLTVEGDPIYHRFHFTGDETVVVADHRADTFGSDGVSARRCTSVGPSATDWLPVGRGCDPVDHPGFPEADDR